MAASHKARNIAQRGALACAAAVSLVSACFASIDEGLLHPRDAGVTDATPDGGSAVPDAGPPYRGVLCGDAACTPPASVCCTGTFGDPDYRNGSCGARDNCQTGDHFACVGPSDCTYTGAAGPRCCVVKDREGAFTRTACAASCDDGELCSTDGPVSCPSGQSCGASLQFPLLFECVR